MGRLVKDQQETIDQVEDKISDAKTTTRAGVDHLQKAFPFSCGVDTTTNDDDDNNNNANNRPPPQIRTDEEFRWSMPFETMGQDIREVVEKDIIGLGNDVVIAMSRSQSMKRATNILNCSSSSIERFADDDDYDEEDNIVAR